MNDVVPWMIGGGIKHSVEVGRLLAYTAFGGSEGIIGSKDLEVRELAVPGPQVRVFSGACAVLNRGVGMAYDAYACRYPLITNVDIAATGSSGPRSDLIVARVENPYQAGEPWPIPSDADIAAGTAIFERIAVISGVPAATKDVASLGLGYSAIPLARITLPASTGTVQQAHITDLRKMSAVQRADTVAVINPSLSEVLTSAAYVNWPTQVLMNVDVPAWATHVNLTAIFAGLAFGGGAGVWNAIGNTRLTMGTLTTEDTGFNFSNNQGGTDTAVTMSGGTVAVPAAMRGTTQTVRSQGVKIAGTNASLSSGTATTVRIEARFSQQPETNL